MYWFGDLGVNHTLNPKIFQSSMKMTNCLPKKTRTMKNYQELGMYLEHTPCWQDPLAKPRLRMHNESQINPNQTYPLWARLSFDDCFRSVRFIHKCQKNTNQIFRLATPCSIAYLVNSLDLLRRPCPAPCRPHLICTSGWFSDSAQRIWRETLSSVWPTGEMNQPTWPFTEKDIYGRNPLGNCTGILTFGCCFFLEELSRRDFFMVFPLLPIFQMLTATTQAIPGQHCQPLPALGHRTFLVLHQRLEPLQKAGSQVTRSERRRVLGWFTCHKQSICVIRDIPCKTGV